MLSDFTHDQGSERLRGVCGGDPSGATAVVLHGAGTGSTKGLLPLVREFVAHGCRGVTFDFSGHGESTGNLWESSLRRRFEQAVAVIDTYVGTDGPLVLVGFGMSGQTVADLVRHYGDRVVALGLCAPAVYAAESWDVPFGEGHGRFSEIIRRPDSWRQAPALEVLQAYEDRAVLAAPATDAAIPPAVTEAIEDALATRAQYTRLELPDAQNPAGRWFRDHDEERREFVEAVLTGLDDRGWTATSAWVAKELGHDRTVADVRLLSGGSSSQMRRLTLDNSTELVQRTLVKPFFRRAGPGLLTREASVLTLLAGEEGIPTPGLIAVDATAEHCDHPTLLMSALPGRVRVDEDDLDLRLDLLAAQLVRVHDVVPVERPRTYQAWTPPERVRTPPGDLWERAVDVIRRDPPPYEGCFLHRDFHPGNVLFTGAGRELRITGVVDWVETSWGPADLDVAHCSTALALLHGPEHGLSFRERYETHGGKDLADDPNHLYWLLLDALHYCPNTTKLGGPWRDLGRDDLMPEVLAQRLETYVDGLLQQYG
ncbi:phosphotransferase [Streptomyces sp. NPDC001185]|uniref:phosphotransferase n=1 Tax=Streptomyces sp. NPDC001185 TaxID=3154380 RepID=UPI00331F118F